MTDKDIDRDDLSTYSTSLDIKKSKAKRLLKMFNKNYPKALLIEGKYQGDMGVALKNNRLERRLYFQSSC